MSGKTRILVSWYTDPRYIPPFQLCEGQVTVGPRINPDQPLMMFKAWTPRGAYDLAAALAEVGIDPRFDAIIVWSDAARTNLPLNLAAFDCPKLLCIGDTHHLDRPLHGLIAYARAAGYDCVALAYARQHLHWFAAAGFRGLAWFPGLPVRHLPAPPALQRLGRIAFIGKSRFHPRRRRLIEAFYSARLPLLAKEAPLEEAFQLYAGSALSFNASLNGDLNLRVFEVLAAGGCLLTDRLAPEAGLDLLLAQDRHYFAYGSAEEMIDKARYLLARPDVAEAVAAAGRRIFAEELAPARRAAQLLDWIMRGRLDSLYGPERDARSVAPDAGEALDQRLLVYETLQELQRQQERPRVLFDARLSHVFLSDAADLLRLDRAVARLGPPPPPAEEAGSCAVSAARLSPAQLAGTSWDCVVAPRGTLLPADMTTAQILFIEEGG